MLENEGFDMPLLMSSDASGTVRLLDSSAYCDAPDKSMGGKGVSSHAFQELTNLMNGRRVTLSALELIIANRKYPDGSLGPFSTDKNGAELTTFDKSFQIQSKAITQAQLNEEIQKGFKLRSTQRQIVSASNHVARSVSAEASRINKLPLVANKSIRPNVSADQVKKSIDLDSLVVEVQQASRNMFSASQSLSLSKMIAEWLTLVEVLIACAEAAEKDLTGLVDGINAERQAMWKLVGDVIGTVLTFAAPPPFGVIIGGVVRAVFAADTWTGCVGTASAAAMSATYKGTEEQWKKDDDTNKWGPSQETVFKAVAVKKSAGGQETLADYKDVPAMVGGLSSCLGKTSREKFEDINKRTLMHLTDMPAPPSDQAKNFATVIREQSKLKIDAVLRAVCDSMNDFMNSDSGSASLVYASYSYQATAITSKLGLMDASMHATYLRDRIREGALLYLNTVAHEVLVSLAKSAKPKFNVTTIDKEKVKAQFEIMFWAGYLGKAALNESKATSLVGKGAPRAGEEAYFAYHYGVIKKLVWRNTVPAKLNALGITRHYPPAKRMGFAVRTPEYELAIKNWRPPTAGQPWVAVPYQDGGSGNSKGRLAAWAVEFNKRPPVEMIEAILG